MARRKLERNDLGRDHETISRFALGGRAVLTLSNSTTHRHVTLKLAQPKEVKINHRTGRPWPKAIFVRIFTGTQVPGVAASNAQRDYVYVGRILLEDRNNTAIAPKLNLDSYKLRDAGIALDDPRVRSIEFLVDFLNKKRELPADVTVWHEGRCCFCGLTLTQTESVKRGYGPDCATARGLPYGKPTRYAKGSGGVGVTDEQVLTVACTHCGVEVGQRCKGPNGNHRRPHGKRRKRAQRRANVAANIAAHTEPEPQPTQPEPEKLVPAKVVIDCMEYEFADDDEDDVLDGDDLAVVEGVA